MVDIQIVLTIQNVIRLSRILPLREVCLKGSLKAIAWYGNSKPF